MAVQTDRGQSPIDRKPPEVRQSFQLWQWLFMRVSGVILLFLALGHLAIQHVFNDVGDLSFAVVAARWSSTFWRTWDWLLLVLAVAHGANGIRVLAEDYIRGHRARLLTLAVVYTIATVTIALGTIVVFTFQAEGAG